MTSRNGRREHLWIQPMDKTNEYARKASNRSDVSLPPSNGSESAESSMAANTDLVQAVDLQHQHAPKNDIEHVEVLPMKAGASNKSHSTTMADITQHKPRRKFKPEAIETSTRSSKKEKASDEPTSPSAKRKFTPESMNTTARSSKPAEDTPAEEKVPKPRHYLTQKQMG